MKLNKFSLFVFVAILATCTVYFYGLDKSPVHLNQDEMAFGLSAYSIAKTGRDVQGNLLPFYFWQLGMLWYTPFVIYITALFLKFIPLSEAAIRLPGAAIAVLSIFILSMAAKKIFKRNIYQVVTIFIGATVPALFINFRIAMDVAWPIPFVALWLLFLLNFSKSKNSFYLFLSGLVLGFGIHSYHAAVVTMPLYLAFTLVYLFFERDLGIKRIAALIIGFLIPIVIFIPWLLAHPDTLLNQVNYVGSIDKSVDTAKGIWGVFNLERLTSFVTNYFTYFSPKILFVMGDKSLIHSTGEVGAFTFGIVFLLLFGVLEVLRRKKDWFSKLILFGFLTYPIAPSIVNDSQRISRGLIVIPFVVLLSTYGVYFLRSQKEKIFKYLTRGILLLITLEFAIFLFDYFGSYRIRSTAWFNNGIGSMYESVIKSTELRKVSKIYVDRNIYFAETYFDFYQIKFNKNLKAETVYFSPQYDDFTKFPAGSIVAIQVSDIPNKPDKIGGFEKIETIRELNGYETFLVYYKDYR